MATAIQQAIVGTTRQTVGGQRQVCSEPLSTQVIPTIKTSQGSDQGSLKQGESD